MVPALMRALEPLTIRALARALVKALGWVVAKALELSLALALEQVLLLSWPLALLTVLGWVLPGCWRHRRCRGWRLALLPSALEKPGAHASRKHPLAPQPATPLANAQVLSHERQVAVLVRSASQPSA